VLVRFVRCGLALGAAWSLLAACSLLTPTDGLSGGPALTDGGPGSSGEAGEASSAEASTSDGSLEAGGDAGPWCATHQGSAALCEDFDTKGLTAWDAIVAGGGGTTAPDPVAWTSPPYAMLSNLPAATSGKVEGYIATKFSVEASDLVLDADFRVDKVNTAASQLQIAKLLQLDGSGDGIWETGVAVNDQRKLVVFQYNYSTNGYAEVFALPASITLGTWIRVKLHLHLQNLLEGTVDLDIDGKRIESNLPVQPLSAKSRFRLFLGAIYADTPHTGWTVRIDNVLLDTH
jgi:hypothetical protein